MITLRQAARSVRAALPGWLASVLRGCRTGLRASRILATDSDLPLVLRVLFIVGCVQVPFLPFDEIALAVALGWLLIFHRASLRSAVAKARA